ncbi:MAG: PAS domain S-box protein [Candidatus Delongbacteria bacterium]|nr:PAS domain S-box protein [Candidatus Delongbacteria bacterium]
MLSKNSFTVLLVEENEDHRILINNVFLRHGSKYSLKTAATFAEAREQIQGTDIIITNLTLPDGSGIGFLRDKNISENIPVVILESFVDQETVVKILKAGVFDYINKTAESFEALPEKIDKYIELSNLKKEKKRISEQQSKLSIAINQSSEAIVITNKEGIIEFVNPAFEKISGYRSSEVLGKKPSLLKSGRHDRKFYENLWKTILSGKPWKGRMINKNKNGDLYEEDASISPVLGSDGKIVNFVALKRDVTEMIRIENQLRHAQKMEGIGTLAAGIAHEINTPLQYLYDNTQFIQESFSKISETFSEHPGHKDKAGDLEYLMSEIPKALEENMNGIKIVRKIVLAMKNFSHPGLKTMNKSDINEAVVSTVTITRNVWKYNAEIETDLKEGLPEVTCHIGDINQVFLNMITNSSDAIGETGRDTPGKIIIRTANDDDFVYITIEDDGAGISQEPQDKIFQPFFTTKQVGKGTGQGLALSYDIIVNKHNGDIKVESEKGKGTRFTIKLPIENNE